VFLAGRRCGNPVGAEPCAFLPKCTRGRVFCRRAFPSCGRRPGLWRPARGPACRLVRQGQAWVGRGGLRAHEPKITATLVAVWTADQKEPWVLVTDLVPRRVGIAWYALRMAIELGFRLLKSLGWQWQHTRRCDPPLRQAQEPRTPLADPGGGHPMDAGLRHLRRSGRENRPAARVPAHATARRRQTTPATPRQHLSPRPRSLLPMPRPRPPLAMLWLTPDPWPQPPANPQITCHDAPP
jgi:hypothetical protein